MASSSLCRCCLVRPPDKNLKTAYTKMGKTEIYSDMLKDCFEIHLSMDDEDDSGICEVCIIRLRESCNFKSQVQKCQKDFAARLIKDEVAPKVKEEMLDTDDENAIYFLELKDEISDFEDEKTLAEMSLYNLKEISVKKKEKPTGKKKLSSIIDKDCKPKKRIRPVKISLSSIAKFSDMLKPTRLISESTKYKDNIDNILKNSNCTPFFNKTLSGLMCIYCKETLPDLNSLRLHNKKHINDSVIDTKRVDKNNLSIKIDITDLECTMCQVKIDLISNLKTHLTKEHDVKFHLDIKDYILEFKLTDDPILNCALCNSKYETFKMLLQHMNGHYRNYICDICDIGFINKHKLTNHQRIHEVGDFNCDFCDKAFTTRVRKLCHEKYTHNSSARYTTNCPHCDQSFTSYYRRNRHMANEHNSAAASYKCNICEKSFILKSKLTSHIKKVHLMERNHICTECGQGFFIKQSLDEHMIRHNGERVFKCSVCNKAYARKKTLREHMRIHNNDRRFKCGVCALAFVQKCSLKSHMLSNHGISLAEYENARTELCT